MSRLNGSSWCGISASSASRASSPDQALGQTHVRFLIFRADAEGSGCRGFRVQVKLVCVEFPVGMEQIASVIGIWTSYQALRRLAAESLSCSVVRDPNTILLGIKAMALCPEMALIGVLNIILWFRL